MLTVSHYHKSGWSSGWSKDYIFTLAASFSLLKEPETVHVCMCKISYIRGSFCNESECGKLHCMEGILLYSIFKQPIPFGSSMCFYIPQPSPVFLLMNLFFWEMYSSLTLPVAALDRGKE